MKLATVLELPILAGTQIKAGIGSMDRAVKSVGVVDHEQPLQFVELHQLVLTTGFAWPREEQAQRKMVSGLAAKGVAGVGLAVPQYFRAAPRAVCDEAETCHLPLLEIPWEIPFSQISSSINRQILEEQYEVREQSERIHRTLTQAAGDVSSFDDLARVLALLLNRPAVFADIDGQVLGCSDPIDEIEEQHGELLEWHVHQEVVDVLRRAERQTEALRVACPDVGLGERVVCPVRLKRELVGWVWLLQGRDPLNELDLRAAEHAALVAGLHMAHQRQISDARAQLGYTFVDSLIYGSDGSDGHSDNAMYESARLMGFAVDASYRLAIIVLDLPLPLSADGLDKRKRMLTDLRALVQRQKAAPFLSPSTNRIYVVLPQAVSVERLWGQLAAHWDRDLHIIAMLVGRTHYGVAGVKESYLELAPLLAHVRYGAIQHYNEALVPNVLRGDQQAQKVLVDDVFGNIEEHPSLLETLVVLSRHGFRQTTAAEALGIHLNSLRYRIRRIATLTSLDITDPETRFHIQLAERLLSIDDKYI